MKDTKDYVKLPKKKGIQKTKNTKNKEKDIISTNLSNTDTNELVKPSDESKKVKRLRSKVENDGKSIDLNAKTVDKTKPISVAVKDNSLKKSSSKTPERSDKNSAKTSSKNLNRIEKKPFTKSGKIEKPTDSEKKSSKRQVETKNIPEKSSTNMIIKKRPLDNNYVGSESNKTNNSLKEDHSDRSKKYKRSDNKYSKEKEERTRSNPKYEYNLEDANENEKELILKGTINDRINCLALLCARNPSEANFKQLLFFCENQRNDIIYLTLKLLRDLIKNKLVSSLYIKNRIIKSFDMGAKNLYIKDKVVEIISVLARAEIYSEDFINILVSRLIEKGETLKLVENALKSLFPVHEKLIFEGIEDFYFKNDAFRCQYTVLKFLANLEVREKGIFFNFYDTALTSLDDYPQEQKDLMIELLVNGLANTVTESDKITNIELIRSYLKTPRSAISVLQLLTKIQDPFTESYVLKVSRTSLLRNTKYEPAFLNLIYKLNNKDLFSKLVDNSFHYSVSSILSLMLIAKEKGVETKYMFSLHMFINHYHPLVRDTARRLLFKEKIQRFDPFDQLYVEGQAKILEL